MPPASQNNSQNHQRQSTPDQDLELQQGGGDLGTGNLEWSNMSRGPGGVNPNLSTISHDGAKFSGETVQYNLMENSNLYNGGGPKRGKKVRRNRKSGPKSAKQNAWMAEVNAVKAELGVPFGQALRIAAERRKGKK